MVQRQFKLSALVLLLVAFALAVAGQLAFRQGPQDGQAKGFLFYGLAALSLLSSLQIAPLHEPDSLLAPVLRAQPVLLAPTYPKLARFLLIVGSLAVLYAALVSTERAIERPQYDLLGIWVVGLVAIMAAFGIWSGVRPLQKLRHLQWPQPEQVLIIMLIVATFLLRVINLEHTPYILSGDEASMGLEAVKVLQGRLSNPFTTSWFSHPTLFFFIQALALAIGGVSTAALRWPSALCAALSVLWLYKLSRRCYGRRVAIVSALLYAAWHYSIHFGRIGLNNIWDPFFVLGVLWYTQRGLDERRLWPWAVAGLLGGLCVYFYMGARLIPVILAMFLALRWLQGARLWREYRLQIASLAAVAVLVALPLLNHYRAQFSDLTARWAMVGIVPNGWLASEPLVTGKTQAQLLLEQFVKSTLAFNLYPDTTFHYWPGIPLLPFLPAMLLILGFVLCLRYPMRRINLLLVGWFFLIAVLGGMLLENPPSSARLLLLIPPVIMMVAYCLVSLIDQIAILLTQPRWLGVLAVICLALSVSYSSVRFYFIKYTPTHSYGGANTEVADAMGRYLRTLGPGYRCYFYGPPRMFYGFATIPFLAQGVEGVDAPVDQGAPMDWITVSDKPVFCFLPERLGEIDRVRLLYPDGSLQQHNNERAQPLFYSYEVTLP